jgi:phospholipase/carboxylesterase
MSANFTSERAGETTLTTPSISRREALRLTIGALNGAVLLGCIPTVEANDQRGGSPRLTARPGVPDLTIAPGRQTFSVSGSTAVIHVPQNYQPTTPSPLVVFLHGALRTVDTFMTGHAPISEDTGAIVLMPLSTVGTWDAINGDFGPDVAIINGALDWVFHRCNIDPGKIVLSGFSDGGTYVIALGRANGDLFSRIVAYSPGFLIDVTRTGRAPFLITHGTQDTVLPIDATSRRIVPALRSAGYTVDYREFTGGHAVPLSIVREMMEAL